MNTLFNTTFETEEASHHEECVRLRPQTYDLQESNVQLKLTIVDAVGFGDQINKDDHQKGLNGTVPGYFGNMKPKKVSVPASQTKKTHNLWDTG